MPLYEKLPSILYGGAFELWLEPLEFWNPNTIRGWGYYFHDHQWYAHGRELLGWSREILHTIKLNFWQRGNLKPNWLCGHGFQIHDDVAYQLSGTARVFPAKQLRVWAEDAIRAFEEADFFYDSWGGIEERHWLSAIQKHMSEGPHASNELIALHCERYGHLEAFIRHQNWSNRLHHPAYVTKEARNSSGISQTEANVILTSRFQNSASTGPATIYSNLFSAAPSDTALGTLAAYTNYAGQAITCNSTNFPVSAGATTYAGGNITFPTCGATGETEVATAWTTVAAPTLATQIIEWGTFANQSIANGNTPQFNNNTVTTSAS